MEIIAIKAQAIICQSGGMYEHDDGTGGFMER